MAVPADEWNVTESSAVSFRTNKLRGGRPGLYAAQDTERECALRWPEECSSCRADSASSASPIWMPGVGSTGRTERVQLLALHACFIGG